MGVDQDWAQFANATISTLQAKFGYSVMSSIIAMLTGAYLNATGYEIALMGLLVFIAVNAFSIARSLKVGRPAFEFIYDENNDHWVQTGHLQRTSYLFGLHILSPQTVDSPNVWMRRGPLTERLFSPEHPSGGYPIYQGGALDPGVTESINLFSLPSARKFLNVKYDGDPIGSRQKFTLEARGRNCKPVIANFEYDPDKTPMVRMLT